MSMDMKLAMSIRTITLIAIPIATGLARNMLTLIAMSMITTTTTTTTMLTAMARITTTMA